LRGRQTQSASQIGALQTRTVEVGIVQHSGAQLRSTKIGASQIGIDENGTPELRAAQVRTRQRG
jgi:hypothetical protein